MTSYLREKQISQVTGAELEMLKAKLKDETRRSLFKKQFAIKILFYFQTALQKATQFLDNRICHFNEKVCDLLQSKNSDTCSAPGSLLNIRLNPMTQDFYVN